MRIISLHAENVKRLKAIDITPSDSTVVIAGRNGQGKTSVLDSILLALAGKDAAKLMTRPIRDGQEEASVEIDLGDYRVKRTWTANDKSYLKVEARDGTKVASPQALLDSWADPISFDPLAFSRQSPRNQRETLLSLADLDFSLDDWQKNYDEVFAERTQVGRDLAQAEGQLAGMPPPEEGTPAEEVSIAELVSQLQEHEEHNRQWLRDCDYLKANEEQIARLEEELRRARETNATIKERMTGLKGLWPVDELKVQVGTAEETNRKVRAGKERDAVAAKADQVRAKHAELTERLEKGRAMKDEALAKAKMPIEGLGIDDDGVTFKGIPFGQLSAAEQLKVSLSIAMAMNPTLKVIRILDGSLLDDDSMRVVQEMVKEKGFQCWIETCHTPEDGCAIIIEDGEVVPNPKP
jgi:DNA repair exonuclease SbcCD ATPase subunit